MNDRETRESRRAAAPLYGLAALGALGATLGKPPRRDDPHFWALTIVAFLVNLVILAVCVYCLIDLWTYFHSTTPCQRMGTC
jgi:hypothetical protein